MKKTIVLLFMLSSFFAANSQSKDEKKLAEAVQFLLSAMQSGNRADLEKIAAEKLSYGHSGGHIENKAAFVENIASGNSMFLKIDIVDQTIDISKNVGIVRHKLDAKTRDKGKDNEAHLFVLYIFQKEGGEWKMLARQAVKNLTH